VTATGGTGPYTWNITGLDGTGGLVANGPTISGTPTNSGIFSLSVMVTDSAPTPAHLTVPLNLTVNPASPPVMITTQSPLPPGTSGIFYTAPVSTTGGTGPYMWSITGITGTGLTATTNPFTTNTISGKPNYFSSAPITISISVTVTDSAIPPTMDMKTLDLTINPPPAQYQSYGSPGPASQDSAFAQGTGAEPIDLVFGNFLYGWRCPALGPVCA